MIYDAFIAYFCLTQGEKTYYYLMKNEARTMVSNPNNKNPDHFLLTAINVGPHTKEVWGVEIIPDIRKPTHNHYTNFSVSVPWAELLKTCLILF